MHNRKMYNYVYQFSAKLGKKITPFGHALPISNIRAKFENNRPIRYSITVKRNYFYIQQTDKRTYLSVLKFGVLLSKKMLIDFSSKCKSAMAVTCTQMQRCDNLYTDSVNLI